MSFPLDQIGKEAPDKSSIPDWKAPSGSPQTPEPSFQKHPEEREQDIEDRKANRKLRAKFAKKAYKVAKYGLYWWAAVILLSAVGKGVGKDIISDQVLIAVTTASTLNLFAAFLGVIRGLFPSGKEAKDKD